MWWGTLETTPAIVCSVEPARITVVLRKDGTPGGHECRSCGLCTGGRRPVRHVVARRDRTPCRRGDPVRVRRPVLNPALASLLVFGAPLGAALTWLIAWYVRSPHTVESIPAALTTVLALAAGFTVPWFGNRTLVRHYPWTIVDFPARSTDVGTGTPAHERMA